MGASMEEFVVFWTWFGLCGISISLGIVAFGILQERRDARILQDRRAAVKEQEAHIRERFERITEGRRSLGLPPVYPVGEEPEVISPLEAAAENEIARLLGEPEPYPIKPAVVVKKTTMVSAGLVSVLAMREQTHAELELRLQKISEQFQETSEKSAQLRKLLDRDSPRRLWARDGLDKLPRQWRSDGEGSVWDAHGNRWADPPRGPSLRAAERPRDLSFNRGRYRR